MTKNLTLVAALPMGGGCMSSLPAEKNEAVPEYMLLAARWMLGDPTIAMLPPEPTVQMKAAYFDHLEFPLIEAPPTIQELAQKYLDAHEGLGC